jgi:hypothetical protein
VTESPSHPLIFGIYPGGPVGAETGLLQGLPDDPPKIHALLEDLQGPTRPPNLIDGRYPNVQQAVTAKSALHALGASHVKVGFNTTPTFGPAEAFWHNLKSIATPAFFESLDYVGLDFFPDVFRPVAPPGTPGDLISFVNGILETMRNVWLPAAGIASHTPIHITEHGWSQPFIRPAGRNPETVIRAIHALAARLNIDRYTLRSRDVILADPSAESHLFNFFGNTTADYQPKPAFSVIRTLIHELRIKFL